MKILVAICLITSLIVSGCQQANMQELSSASVPASAASEPSVSTSSMAAEPAEVFHTVMNANGRRGDYGNLRWSDDGQQLEAQNENTIQFIGLDNRVARTVVLDKAQLPKHYTIKLTSDYIFVLNDLEGISQDACIYKTDEGFQLANLSIWDKEGKLVRAYPDYLRFYYDEQGGYHVLPDDASGNAVEYDIPLAEGYNIYQIDADKLAIDGHSRVLVYSIADDSAVVVDDMTAFMPVSKDNAYLGVESFQCYVHDGKYYYLAHKNVERYNVVGTVWEADEHGSRMLFDGKEVSYFYMKDGIMVSCLFSEEYSDENQFFYATADKPEWIYIGKYPFNTPLVVVNGVIVFGDSISNKFFAYDTSTGNMRESSEPILDRKGMEYDPHTFNPAVTHFYQYSKDSIGVRVVAVEPAV